MSTVILLALSIGIIFWHPPFRLPYMIKKTMIPLMLIIILSSLLLVDSFNSNSREDGRSQSASQADSDAQQRQQIQFTR